jgi:hypothetical protein
MTQQPASPPDVYSIAVMTKSSSMVGNLLTGQISHDKIYYGQIVLLSYRKENRKRVRLYAWPKFPGFDRGSGYSCDYIFHLVFVFHFGFRFFGMFKNYLFKTPQNAFGRTWIIKHIFEVRNFIVWGIKDKRYIYTFAISFFF